MSEILKYSMVNPRRLPDSFVPVAYIESSGSSFIDSGLICPLKITIVFKYIKYDTLSCNPFGVDFSSYPRYMHGHIYNGNIYCGNSSATSVNEKLGEINSGYVTIGDSTISGRMNGVDFSASYSNWTGCSYSDYIFATRSSSSGGASYVSKMRLYELRYLDANGSLLGDFVPCVNSSGTAGVFDIVKLEFHTAVIGSFTAGPEIRVLPQDYCLVEYLLFPIGAYINTGFSIAASDVTKTEAMMWYASGGSGRDLMGWSSADANYWGVTSAGAWEKATGSNSDITKRLKVTYNYTADTAGTYLIGKLGDNYSVRSKYIESFKVSIGGTLKVDLIPCYRRSDGKPGMYDLIRKTFYVNANTSNEFLLGPTIEESSRLLEWNLMGINKYPYSSTRTITTTSTSSSNRISNLGFNYIPGPWTISFDAYASSATSVTTDICDQGSKILNITTTKQRFFVTATAVNYYTPDNYNGFWDLLTGTTAGITIYISNIVMTLGTATSAVPYIGSSALPTSLHSSPENPNGVCHHLPAGYLEVEWIASTDSEKAYINTGITTSNTTRLVTSIYPTSTLSGAHFWFGSRNGGSSTQAFVLYLNGTNTGYLLAAWNTSGNTSLSVSGLKWYNIDFNANVLTINGSTAYTFTAGTFTGTYPIFLFAMNTSGSMDSKKGAIQMKATLIYSGTTLQRNMIPCVRLSDSKVGMYDLVEGTFYSSANTSYSFKAGPVIGNNWGSGEFGTNSFVCGTSLSSAKSVSFWINIPSTTWATESHIVFLDGASTLAFGVWNNTRAIITCNGSSITQYSVNPFKITGWHHIVVTKTNRKLYLDGTEITTTSGTDVWSYSKDELLIGGRNVSGTSAYNTNAELYNMRFFDLELSATEVQQLYLEK